MFVALFSAIVNIGFLASYPIWSTIMIALDILIIWALTVHGSRAARGLSVVASGVASEVPPQGGPQPRAWPHVDEGVGNREAQVRRGKAARSIAPRAGQGEWQPGIGRGRPGHDPDEPGERGEALVPLRNARMLASPFAFFRGSAAIMAADLAHTPRSGINAQLCGDAHLSNIGGYAAPDRELVFDLNDFDETLPGPWEWDAKALLASLAIAGRESGFSDRERAAVVRSGAAAYRKAMREFAAMGSLQVYYSRMTVADVRAGWGGEVDKKTTRAFERNVEKSMTKDSVRAAAKLTRSKGGSPRIAQRSASGRTRLPPPRSPRRTGLRGGGRADPAQLPVQPLDPGRRHLPERYRFVDAARKVVGVGSVGTRAWVVLMLGIVDDEPLMLQLKEASPSVLADFAGRSRYENQGQRVVVGHSMLQSASDVFLGWTRIAGVDGVARDFYIRQLWDWTSFDVGGQSPSTMRIYAQLCGWILARAHAASGDRVAIAAYLGQGDAFDVAMADFAEAYADQNDRDYHRFVDGVREHRFQVSPDV